MLGHFESGMQALVFSSLTVPYAHRQSLVISELHGWNLFVSLISKLRRLDNSIIPGLTIGGQSSESEFGLLQLASHNFPHTFISSFFSHFISLPATSQCSLISVYREKSSSRIYRKKIHRQISICREIGILTNKNRNNKYAHDVSWHGDVFFFESSI